ncbi:hypothetical protein [Spirosoma aerophilum]
MRALTLLAALLTATFTYAQDNIILRNGGEIPAKVLEVTPSDLKYRKADNPDGPVYTAPIRDVLIIKYANGTKDSFESAATPVIGPRQAGPRQAQTVTVTVGPDGVKSLSNSSSGLSSLRYRSRFLNHHFVDGTGERISLNETESVLQLQPDALRSFDRGRSLKTWSTVTGISAAALIGVGVGVAVGGRWDRMDGRGRGIDGPNGPGNDPTMDGRLGGRDDNRRVGAALVGGGVVLGLASLWLEHRATKNFRRAANQYNQRPATSLHLSPSSTSLGMGLALRF